MNEHLRDAVWLAVVVGALDALSTWVALRLGALEANPLAMWAQDRVGVVPAVIASVAVVPLVVTAVDGVRSRLPARWATLLQPAVTAGVYLGFVFGRGIVLGNNLVVIGNLT